MKNRIILAMTLMLCFILLFSLAACSTQEKQDAMAELHKVKFEDQTFIYDGKVHSIQATNIPAEAQVTYNGNEQTDIGSYKVSVLITYKKNEIELTATMTIKFDKDEDEIMAALNNVKFEDQTFIYDGQMHSILATNIPEGAEVNYFGNNQIEFGQYEVVVTITYYRKEIDLFATMTIKFDKEEAEILAALNNVKFEDKTFIYNGSPHSILITNKPEGADVLYYGNAQTEPGNYKVKVKIIYYCHEIELTATMTIKFDKEEAEILAALNNVKFEDKLFPYDGAAHSILATNIPEGAEVVYDGNSKTQIGSYKVKVTITYYRKEIVLTATMRIEVGLSKASDLVKLKDYKGVICLANDIDCSGLTDFKPITGFTGTLDGQNHKIYNLTFDSYDDNAGFFAETSGNVSNIVFENIKINASGNNVGIVAGKSVDGKFENVKVVNGSIVAKSSSNVGGIVGYANDVVINKSTNSATINGNKNVGGIVGYEIVYDLGVDIMNGNTNAGNINGKDNVGGIAGEVHLEKEGYFTNGLKLSHFKNVKNEGEINASNAVGGCFGRMNGFQSGYDERRPTLVGAVNSGKVTASGDAVGGIIGNGDGTHSVKASSNTADIQGRHYVGGLVGNAPRVIVVAIQPNNNIITGETYVGGFAGLCGSITDAVNKGQIVSTAFNTEGSDSVAYVGGVAGQCREINNCSNEVDITVNHIGGYVGGVAGRANVSEGSSSANLSNKGSITAKGFAVGGVFGCLEMNLTSKVTALNNTGNVSAGTKVGGVIGALATYAGGEYHAAVRTSMLRGATNNGAVNGRSYVGGIVGYGKGYVDLADIRMFDITSSTNNSVITSEGDYAGGIVGFIEQGRNITGCVNNADITGQNYVGGLVGSARDASINAAGAINTNTITGAAYVGGFAGLCGDISYATNTGNIVSGAAMTQGTTLVAAVGGIAGQAGSVNDCKNTVNIVRAHDGNYVGGIAGMAFTSRDVNSENIVNEGVIGALGDGIGGVFGKATMNLENSMFNVKNTKPVTGNNKVGGIIGELATYGTGNVDEYHNAIRIATLSKLSNAEQVRGKASVGGVIGYARGYTDEGDRRRFKIATASNKGVILAEGDGAGGIVGDAENIVSITNATNEANITGYNYVGGIVGRSPETLLEMAGAINKNVITGYSCVGGFAGYAGLINNATNDGMIDSSKSGIVDSKGKPVTAVGGIAGVSGGNNFCTNNVDIIITHKGYSVGGIAGIMVTPFDSKIEKNTNNGVIKAVEAEVGGIAGTIYNGRNTTLDSFTNTGILYGNQAGGIAGVVTYRTTGAYINKDTVSPLTNMKNTAEYITGREAVGGLYGAITGYVDSGDKRCFSLTNSICSAKICGHDTMTVLAGGIVSYATHIAAVTECRFTGTKGEGLQTALYDPVCPQLKTVKVG